MILMKVDHKLYLMLSGKSVMFLFPISQEVYIWASTFSSDPYSTFLWLPLHSPTKSVYHNKYSVHATNILILMKILL